MYPMDNNDCSSRYDRSRTSQNPYEEPSDLRHGVDRLGSQLSGYQEDSLFHQTNLGPIEQAFLRRLYEVQHELPYLDNVQEQRRVAQEDLRAIYQRIDLSFVHERQGGFGLPEDDGNEEDGGECTPENPGNGNEDDNESNSDEDDRENVIPYDPYSGYPLTEDLDLGDSEGPFLSEDDGSKSDDGPTPSQAEPYVATSTLSQGRGPSV